MSWSLAGGTNVPENLEGSAAAEERNHKESQSPGMDWKPQDNQSIIHPAYVTGPNVPVFLSLVLQLILFPAPPIKYTLRRLTWRGNTVLLDSVPSRLGEDRFKTCCGLVAMMGEVTSPATTYMVILSKHF